MAQRLWSSCPPWFWRSHDGHQVDLVVWVGGRLLPMEVKLTATPTPRHVAALLRFRDLAGADATEAGVLVCRVKEPILLPGGVRAMPPSAFSAWLSAALA